MEHFTSREEPRGYYTSVSPVQVSDNVVVYTAFTGLKECILPVKRKSNKQLEVAKEMYEQVRDEMLGALNVGRARMTS